jgi:hypothetical protein
LWEEVGTEWRKMRKEDLHDFCSSDLMLFRWSKKEEKDKLGMVGKLGQKKLLGRTIHRWEDKIKRDFKKKGWEGVR